MIRKLALHDSVSTAKYHSLKSNDDGGHAVNRPSSKREQKASSSSEEFFETLQPLEKRRRAQSKEMFEEPPPSRNNDKGAISHSPSSKHQQISRDVQEESLETRQPSKKRRKVSRARYNSDLEASTSDAEPPRKHTKTMGKTNRDDLQPSPRSSRKRR